MDTIHEFINFTEKVAKYAYQIKIGQNKGLFGIDISPYGISPYFDDCENSTIYRRSISEIANELFEWDIKKDSLELLNQARVRDAYADELTLQGR